MPTTPPRTRLAQLPTPLEPLRNLSREMGGPMIWMKRDDLTEGPASGNKIRKFEYSFGQALEEKATVIISGGAIQSNSCRAAAFASARLGLKCHFILAGPPPPDVKDGNLFLDDLMGATCSFIPFERFSEMDGMFEDLAAEYVKKGERPFIIPPGAGDEIGLWGYINCAQELKSDFETHGIEPSHILSATGSGTTLGGLMIGAETYGLNSVVEGVAILGHAAYFENKISRTFDAWSARYGSPLDVNALDTRIIEGYVGRGYGLADQHVYDTIRQLARADGLILEPVYTGKGFDGMLQEIRKGRYADSKDIVFIHTGGIYGLFPHRDAFFS